jgi:imidazolonepropionase-like amidohydrolase
MRSATAFVAAAAVAAACAPPREAPVARSDSTMASDSVLVLTNATVIAMDGGAPQENRTIVIRAGRIVSVEPSEGAAIPARSHTVDARGKFVIPGLWDMHVHTSREGRARYFWPLFLAHGVTGVREMGSYLDTLLYWRAELARAPLEGPRIVWSSPMFDGAPASWKHGLPLAAPAEARVMVDSMQRLGFDFIKVYVRLRREVYFAIAEQAKLRGMPFAGHLPGSIELNEASSAGQRSLEHSDGIYFACVPGAAALLDSVFATRDAGARSALERRLAERLLARFDPSACAGVLSALAANRTWVVPTLAVIRGHALVRDSAMLQDARQEFVPPDLVERWLADAREDATEDPAEQLAFEEEMFRRSVRLAGILHAAGVRLLAGTDASDEPFVYAGSSLHDELELLVAGGLSPLDALAAATSGPAEFLGLSDSLGTVEPGRSADLVVLDASPLTDIRNTRRIHAVIRGGRYIGPEERERLLAAARAEAARAVPSPPAQQ